MGRNRAGEARKRRLKRRRWHEQWRTSHPLGLVDPRTLEEMGEQADCHLLPQWCGISGKTVRLGMKIDNDLGSACESELAKYLNLLFGSELPGKVAMAGGSRSLTATYHVVSGEIAVHPPARSDQVKFVERAMGVKGGQGELQSFTGGAADGHLAGLSAVHSAMLVLHYCHRPEIYGPEFDSVRGLFKSALEGSLSDEQRANISARVKFEFLAPAADATRGEVGIDEFRRLYRPDRIADDGVDVHFPHRSVTDYRDQIVVTLPYSKNIRAHVMFLKAKRRHMRSGHHSP